MVDHWFQTKAQANAHLVATYLCLTRHGEIGGFFAIKNIVVATTTFPGRLRAGANAQGHSIAVLLAYLGVSTAHQRRGIGRLATKAALRTALQIHNMAPMQLMVVDALDEQLVPFYERIGFRRIAPSELRLAMPMSTVRKALGDECPGR